MRTDKIKFAGAFLQGAGHHVAAWRRGSAQIDGASNVQHYANLAAIAERLASWTCCSCRTAWH